VPFVNLQVSHDPGQVWVLVSAMAMMAGLVVSLLVRRRRVWVRLHTATPGTVNVQVGGLARTDNAGWGDEFERLVERLHDGLEKGAVPTEPVGTGRSSE
jgi:cytochrome c biogenesis protein